VATDKDEKESKLGVVEYVARFAGYLPELLEYLGTPRPVARAVRHAVRLVPAIRNAADSSRSSDGLEDALNGRFTSMLASQQQLDQRCGTLELENTRMKLELAGTASQVELLKSETIALRIEIESLQRRNVYLTVGVVVVFVLAASEFALRFAK
jgi:hypothetical protein